MITLAGLMVCIKLEMHSIESFFLLNILTDMELRGFTMHGFLSGQQIKGGGLKIHGRAVSDR